MKLPKLLILFFSISFSNVSAQRLAVAPLGKIYHDGFHQVLMDPLHRSMAARDLSNIRLMDVSGKEIPYLIRQHGSVPVRNLDFTRHEDKEKKTSFIRVRFLYPVEINRMRLNIAGPALFQRRAIITFPTDGGSYYHELSLKSKGDSIYVYDLPNVYTRWFDLAIENEDNAPLDIPSIQCTQPGTFLVADLKMTGEYELVYYDSTMPAPRYDLRFFEDKISDELDMVKPGEIKLLNTHTDPQPALAEKEPAFWETTWFMWVCIGIVGLMVVVIGGRMIREMRGRE